MFAYIDSDEIENKFYFADKSEGQFIEIEQKMSLQNVLNVMIMI